MVVFQLGWMAIFFMFMAGNGLMLRRAMVSVVEKSEREEEPELSPTGLATWINRWEGRRFTSKMQWLGLPLLQIAFSDPSVHYNSLKPKLLVARGWIAIGDHARGRLIALGHIAIAPIAAGTAALGIVAFGVASLGVLTFGVASLAVASIGVVSLGAWSGGVVAIGWATEGVIALGIDSANGVIAFSLDKATGLLTNGAPLKTPESEALLSHSRLHAFMLSVGRRLQPLGAFRFVALLLLFPAVLAMLCVAYRRKRNVTCYALTGTSARLSGDPPIVRIRLRLHVCQDFARYKSRYHR